MSVTPRWGIVATVAEPAPLILAFVAHHLSLGASEIHLYFDDPYDPAADILDWIPPVRVTRCNRQYWAEAAPRRPHRQNNRQSVNATRAQSVCRVDFLLSCDADEFLRPRSDVPLQLSEMPESATWMKVFNLERTMIRGTRQTTIFDGAFKVHYQGRDDTALRTSELAPFGFTSHAAGKPFVRTRVGLNIGIHVPRHGHIKDRVVPPHYPADQIELAHFDGLTPLHWAAKFIRQAANSPELLAQLPAFRISQWREIMGLVSDLPALRALYERLNGYAPEELETLQEDGYITRDHYDLAPALEAVFPGQTIDLTPEHFDALLQPKVDKWLKKARKAGVI